MTYNINFVLAVEEVLKIRRQECSILLTEIKQAIAGANQ